MSLISDFRRRWPSVMKYAAIGCISLGIACASASAQQPNNPQLDELKARIEKLEKQNQQLMEMLQQRTIVPATAAAQTPTQDRTNLEVRMLVQSILKDQEDKKKVDEDNKKKEAAENGTEVGSLLNMNATWRNGLWVETPDNAFRVHVGGRLQPDLLFMDAKNEMQVAPPVGVGPVDDAVNFRRARFAVEGSMWDLIEFNVEFDFINTFNADRVGTPLVANTPAPTDAWIQFDKVPMLGYLRIGNQKPMISFEHLTSSRFLNFMERSTAFDAFIGGLDNGFRPGIQAFNQFLDNHIIASAGIFKNNNTVFGWNVGDGEYDFTTRMVVLPIFEDNGRFLVHTALGYSHRDLDDNQARFRARTLLRNGPPTLQTVLSDVRLQSNAGQDLLVPEFVAVCGPFSFQSEYFGTNVKDAQPIGGGPIQKNAYFQSWYAEAHYFLTGEHRPYNKMIGAFDRVIPNEPYFFTEGDCGPLWGKGAWQVAFRYGYTDLNSGQFHGGQIQDFTVGLNWFLNPNLKFQWNYVYAFRDAVAPNIDGVVQGFGMRAALDF